ncbi:phage tail protein [Cellulomonas sp. zg-ZUI222]|uniref:Phage tail protein n=1 Tax=Cellulomonas wangleii TaxID=2816956 RepID=A0ABX8DA97_9CELL|nr:phage tail protein [Cellulomonas sp. zg-ZUI22]MBO0920044.1 phage tail protein [Cellulomonas wangleii]MBO0923527.1 phage tail protein [Cellulomonas wangleii]QVI64343.1 phage tail protein [Cellulomonas wangleii]
MGGGVPTTSGRFLLEVDGVEIGTFREVQGLRLDVDVVEHVEGGQNGYVHQLPGVMRWPHLVFTRGMVQSDALFGWVQRSSGQGFAGNGDTLTRATGAVTVLDDRGNRMRSWELDGVFAVSWTGPALSADSDAPLTESLEVAHHGFRAVTR